MWAEGASVRMRRPRVVDIGRGDQAPRQPLGSGASPRISELDPKPLRITSFARGGCGRGDRVKSKTECLLMLTNRRFNRTSRPEGRGDRAPRRPLGSG